MPSIVTGTSPNTTLTVECLHRVCLFTTTTTHLGIERSIVVCTDTDPETAVAWYNRRHAPYTWIVTVILEIDPRDPASVYTSSHVAQALTKGATSVRKRIALALRLADYIGCGVEFHNDDAAFRGWSTETVVDPAHALRIVTAVS